MWTTQVTEARITYKLGEYKIGSEEFDYRAMTFENQKFNLMVDGDKGVEIAGHWNIVSGNGTVNGLALFDVVKMDSDGFYIEEMGDNCICIEGGVWTFQDCQVRKEYFHCFLMVNLSLKHKDRFSQVELQCAHPIMHGSFG